MQNNLPEKVWRFPSKVLLAGGYAVLQAENVGLVLALANYFYAYYYRSGAESCRITVRSPQIDKIWEYSYDGEIHGDETNAFVRAALQQSLKYFKNAAKQHITIVLLFDEAFLSNSTDKQPKKTGLGSSACVTVAIVSMICFINNQHDRAVINRLAQIANLVAQKSIGSNFDISSVIYGSQVYTNKIPRIIRSYLNHQVSFQKIFESADGVQPISTPIHIICHMIDLKKGSDTRKMVGSFMKNLNGLPQETINNFYRRSRSIVQRLSTAYRSADIPTMKTINIEHRQLQQEYSHLTGVQIEPLPVRQLIDQIMENPSVIYVICPGSGGYDAICVLTSHNITLDIGYKVRKILTSHYGMEQTAFPKHITLF